MRALLVALACCASGACLLRQPRPDPEPLASTHETRRHSRPDGSLESEVVLLVSPDGRVVRDGFERTFQPDGRLAAERFFARGVPTGVWRSWFADGRPRSETDFGPPGSEDLRTSRYWHPGGRLAAEGTLRAGVREGLWSTYSPEGGTLSTGAYREGLRDGRWVFYDPRGRKQAEGSYCRGERVGRWTLWDEQGQPHESKGEVPDEALTPPGTFPPRRLNSCSGVPKSAVRVRRRTAGAPATTVSSLTPPPHQRKPPERRERSVLLCAS